MSRSRFGIWLSHTTYIISASSSFSSAIHLCDWLFIRSMPRSALCLVPPIPACAISSRYSRVSSATPALTSSRFICLCSTGPLDRVLYPGIVGSSTFTFNALRRARLLASGHWPSAHRLIKMKMPVLTELVIEDDSQYLLKSIAGSEFDASRLSD